MLCEQTSPKRWLAKVNMTSYCDVTNSVYPITTTTIRHCSIVEFGRGHPIKKSPRTLPDLCTPLAQDLSVSFLESLRRRNCNFCWKNEDNFLCRSRCFCKENHGYALMGARNVGKRKVLKTIFKEKNFSQENMI